jgi:hypothetical protein
MDLRGVPFLHRQSDLERGVVALAIASAATPLARAAGAIEDCRTAGINRDPPACDNGVDEVAIAGAEVQHAVVRASPRLNCCSG